MNRDRLQKIVDKNVKEFSGEYEVIVKARSEVLSQLGLRDEGIGLKAALILQWLLRLYARKVGEEKVLKFVRELVGNHHELTSGNS